MDEKLIRERDAVVDRMRRELRALVRESGWTQRRVEEVNGFTQGYLSQVLQGHITLTVRHLFGVLFALGIRPEDFFGRIFDHALPGEIRERLDRYETLFERLEQQGLLAPEGSGDG